jgi:hypothetical protein
MPVFPFSADNTVQAMITQMSPKASPPDDGFTPTRSAFVHNITAIVGCGYCAAFTGAVIIRATGFDPASSNTNLLMWYSPAVWWAGLFLGFVLNWRKRDYAACMTWLSGILLLSLLASDLFWVTRSWDQTRADIFPLWRGEHSPDDELGIIQLFFVWPAINSIAYSLGASIPLLLGTKRKHS